MSTGIATVAVLSPIVASNAVFSVRRASRGVDAIQDNPLYAATNMDIAAGQVTKGAKAATAIAQVSDPTFKATAEGATKTIKNISESNKVFAGVGKVVGYTAEHINPIICIGSTMKVLGSKDKVDEGARETIKIGTMFGAEAIAKPLFGMPVTKKFNGKTIIFNKDAKIMKLFNEKQLNAIKDFTASKEWMKYAPGVAKGLGFVCASIAGYNLGTVLSDAILGKKEKKTNA